MRKTWHQILGLNVFKPPAAEPVIVDKTLSRFVAVSYLMLLLWGVFSIVGSAPAVAQTAGHEVGFYWSIAITSITAFAFIGSLFRWPAIELYAVSALICVIGVYPAAVLILVATDLAHASSVFLAAYVLILPVWRLLFLIGKVGRRQ